MSLEQEQAEIDDYHNNQGLFDVLGEVLKPNN